MATISDSDFDEFDSDAGPPPTFWKMKGVKFEASFNDMFTLSRVCPAPAGESLSRSTHESSLRSLPPEFTTLRDLGNEAFRDGKAWEAILFYTRAIAEHWNDPRLYANRAAAHLAVGWVAPALLDAERALELDPQWIKAHYRMGQVLVALKRFPEAFRFFTRVHHLAPMDEYCFAMLTWVREQAGLLPDPGVSEPLPVKARRAYGSSNVFAWGEGWGGVLGNGDEVHAVGPMAVGRLRGLQMADVACGEYHVLAVTAQGECWTWGSNRQFQLGLGAAHPLAKRSLAVPVPVPLFVGTKVTAVACGESHSVAITNSLEVYTWGAGSSGQLGHGDFQPRVQPTRVEALLRAVADVALEVGDHPALPEPPLEDPHLLRPEVKESDFEEVDIPPPPIRIGVACGASHTVFTVNGNLYVCGWNTRGQLGLAHLNNVNTPTPLILAEAVWSGIPPGPPDDDLPTRLQRVGGGFAQIPMSLQEMEELEAMGINPREAVASKAHEALLIRKQEYRDKFLSFATMPGVPGALKPDPDAPLLEAPPGRGNYTVAMGNACSVTCGLYHTVVIDDKGRTWTAGSGVFGQLGYDRDHVVKAFRYRDAMSARRFRMADVQPPHTKPLHAKKRAPFYTSMFHMVPALVTTPASMAAAGHHCTAVVGTDGRLRMFGRGDGGQIGDGNFAHSWAPVVPPALEDVRVVHVTVRESQVVARRQDGETLSWGAGLGLKFKEFFPTLATEAAKYDKPIGRLEASVKVIFGEKKSPRRVPQDQQYWEAIALESGALPDSDAEREGGTDSEGETAAMAGLEGVALVLEKAKWKKRRAEAKLKPKKRVRPRFQAGTVGYVEDEEDDVEDRIRAELVASTTGPPAGLAATGLRGVPTLVALDFGGPRPVRLVCGKRFYVALTTGVEPKACQVVTTLRGVAGTTLAAELRGTVAAAQEESAASRQSANMLKGLSVLPAGMQELVKRASTLHAKDFKGGIGLDGSSPAERARKARNAQRNESRAFGKLLSDYLDDMDAEAGAAAAAVAAREFRRIPELVAGDVLVFRLEARDAGGRLDSTGNEQFEAFTVHESSNAIVPILVHNGFDGTYRVEARPAAVGRHLASIKLYGTHISGSPFWVRVRAGPACANASEVFLMDGDGRRTDVEFRDHQAVRKYHHGFDALTDPRVPPWRPCRGLVTPVEVVHRQPLRVGITIRDACGNPLTEHVVMRRVVVQFRRALSPAYSFPTSNLALTSFHMQAAAMAALTQGAYGGGEEEEDTEHWLAGVHGEPSLFNSEEGEPVMPLTTVQQWMVEGVPSAAPLTSAKVFLGPDIATDDNPRVNFRVVPPARDIVWPLLEFHATGGAADPAWCLLCRLPMGLVYEEAALPNKPRVRHLMRPRPDDSDDSTVLSDVVAVGGRDHTPPPPSPSSSDTSGGATAMMTAMDGVMARVKGWAADRMRPPSPKPRKSRRGKKGSRPRTAAAGRRRRAGNSRRKYRNEFLVDAPTSLPLSPVKLVARLAQSAAVERPPASTTRSLPARPRTAGGGARTRRPQRGGKPLPLFTPPLRAVTSGFAAGAGGQYSFVVPGTGLRPLPPTPGPDVADYGFDGHRILPPKVRGRRRRSESPPSPVPTPSPPRTPTPPPSPDAVPDPVFTAGEANCVGVVLRDGRGHLTLKGVLRATLVGPSDVTCFVLPINPARLEMAAPRPKEIQAMIRSFWKVKGVLGLPPGEPVVRSHTWAVLFAPVVTGEYTLRVTVDGVDVANSPVPIMVEPSKGAAALSSFHTEHPLGGTERVNATPPELTVDESLGLVAAAPKRQLSRVVRVGSRHAFTVSACDVWGNRAGRRRNTVRVRVQRLQMADDLEEWAEAPPSEPSSDEEEDPLELAKLAQRKADEARLPALPPMSRRELEAERLRWRDLPGAGVEVVDDGHGPLQVSYVVSEPGRLRVAVWHNSTMLAGMPVYMLALPRAATEVARPDFRWLLRKQPVHTRIAAFGKLRADTYTSDRDSAYARLLARLARETESRMDDYERLLVKEAQAADVHNRCVARYHFEASAGATLELLRAEEAELMDDALRGERRAKATVELWLALLRLRDDRLGVLPLGGGFKSVPLVPAKGGAPPPV